MMHLKRVARTSHNLKFTFPVFRAHQGSQLLKQTITGKNTINRRTLGTKCPRRSTIEHQRNCSSDAVIKEGASAATPHALH